VQFGNEQTQGRNPTLDLQRIFLFFIFKIFLTLEKTLARDQHFFWGEFSHYGDKKICKKNKNKTLLCLGKKIKKSFRLIQG
jgi:hypothetical protein